MKTKPGAEKSLLIAWAIVPAAAIATAFAAPEALAEEGDLDPNFADVGRLAAIEGAEGPAWSLVALDDDEVLLAGGDFDMLCGKDGKDVYCDSPPVGFRATNFLITISDRGEITSRIDTAEFRQVQIRDVVRQDDGKLVAVGRRALGERSLETRLTVLRLEADGRLDGTFGDGGLVELPIESLHLNLGGRAVILDPDGRIVVAGSRDGRLFVLRLLPNGSFDDSFGESGIYDPFGVASTGVGILRNSDGGYRVISDACTVAALTPDGALDLAFGTSGITKVATFSFCSSIATQRDGRLLVAGRSYQSGLGPAFVVRLLTNGRPDPSFAAGAFPDASTGATALFVEKDDSVLVAVAKADGALIMRLQANGEVDPQFGDAGGTWIDLPSELGSLPRVHKLLVRRYGSIVAAGGDYLAWWRPAKPFAVRLLGRDGGIGPGVLSFAEYSVRASEEDEEVVVNVRRTGGRSGSVSVAYRTGTHTYYPATAGEDFGEVSGFLTWSDGDMTPREIHISIYDDNITEGEEYFRVTLNDEQGGAGLGTRNVVVWIHDVPGGGDGGTSEVQLLASEATIGEAGGSIVLTVVRNGAAGGAASVEYTTSSGTATAGTDFTSRSGTLSWADGESASKRITVSITNDTTDESDETFTLTLSNPSAGTGLGSNSTATITIADDDAPGGGGGDSSLGFTSNAATINEAGGSVVLTFLRGGSSVGAVSVDYTTSSGTATAGTDFTTASGTLNWAEGDFANKTITVNVTNDTIDESDETFTVSLSNPSAGAVLGTISTATVTITDDDAPAPSGDGDGGGGALDWLVLFVLTSFYLYRQQARMASGLRIACVSLTRSMRT